MVMDIPVCILVMLSIAPIRDEMMTRTGRRFVRKKKYSCIQCLYLLYLGQKDIMSVNAPTNPNFNLDPKTFYGIMSGVLS